jgi:hypothetical protein
MATFGYSALAVRETPTAGYPTPRLLDRVRDAIHARHYSRRTEKTYVAWIKRYIFFHGKRHPAEMGAVEVTRFLTSLASDAKGAKDGVTMLPAAAKPGLMRHLDGVRRQHDHDLRGGAGWVEMPDALGPKYPNAGREWAWQWVFPASGHTSIPSRASAAAI